MEPWKMCTHTHHLHPAETRWGLRYLALGLAAGAFFFGGTSEEMAERERGSGWREERRDGRRR